MGIEKNKDQWFYFEEVLLRDDYMLSDAIFESIADSLDVNQNIEDLHRATLYVNEANGTTVDLLAHYISREVVGCAAAPTLFRGSNPASKMYSAYVKTQPGLDYLHSTLMLPLYNLCSKYGEVNLELNPHNLQEGQSATVNKYNLMSACQQIFEAIRDAQEDCPPVLRAILYKLRTIVSTKFPDYELKIVGAFVFLRFFCPVIAAPLSYGLLKEEPEESARRLLVLTSKTLMNLANGVKFGVKEEYMQVMNDFIETNLPETLEYYEAISSLPDESDSDSTTDLLDSLDLSPQVLPPEVKEVSLALLHSFMLEKSESVFAQLRKHAQSEEQSTKAESMIRLVQSVLEVISAPVQFEEEEEDVF